MVLARGFREESDDGAFNCLKWWLLLSESGPFPFGKLWLTGQRSIALADLERGHHMQPTYVMMLIA